MFKNILNNLNQLSLKSAYWLSYCAIGIALLVTALYFQYVLEELPCVVCIQVRLWVSLLIFLAFSGLLLRGSRWVNVINLAIFMVAVGLVERSYLLLGTERGFIFADCGFDLGLPAWFAIEESLPWLYQVETSCGYTPELLFGITMAESLMLLSVVFSVISLAMLISGLTQMYKSAKI